MVTRFQIYFQNPFGALSTVPENTQWRHFSKTWGGGRLDQRPFRSTLKPPRETGIRVVYIRQFIHNFNTSRISLIAELAY